MSGPLWVAMDARPRRKPADVLNAGIPTDPGVYAWYRRGGAIYVGKADSLQQRLWSNHLGRGRVMTGSAFRRNVAQHLGIATANDIKTKVYQPTTRYGPFATSSTAARSRGSPARRSRRRSTSRQG